MGLACAGETSTKGVTLINKETQALIALLSATIALAFAAQRWMKAAENAARTLR